MLGKASTVFSAPTSATAGSNRRVSRFSRARASRFHPAGSTEQATRWIPCHGHFSYRGLLSVVRFVTAVSSQLIHAECLFVVQFRLGGDLPLEIRAPFVSRRSSGDQTGVRSENSPNTPPELVLKPTNPWLEPVSYTHLTLPTKRIV